MERLTPLLSQYKKIKNQHKDAILLFRMGDFYEMFYEDAIEGAKILNITLTSRQYKDVKIPLAGVPVKSIQKYLLTLIKTGKKVAICEQVEEPEKGKKLVKREVVEIITPGTITREDLLPDTAIYIGSIYPGKNRITAFSYCDVSTGEFYTFEANIETIKEEIGRIEIKQLLHPDNISLTELGLDFSKDIFLTSLPLFYFEEDMALSQILSHFNIVNLDGFGLSDKKYAIRSSGALLRYIKENLKNIVPQIRRISIHIPEKYMYLDKTSIKNLELIERIRGEEKNSFFFTINRTETASGKRKLKKWSLMPLIYKNEIEERLETVEEFLKNIEKVKEIKKHLRTMGDPERITTKVISEKANPRDILKLKSIMENSLKIKEKLNYFNKPLIEKIKKGIKDVSGLIKKIEVTLREDAPLQIGDREMIKEGVSCQLDEMKNVSKNTKRYILHLEEEEKRKTGIPKLRIKYNSVFGYYIEVTKSYINMVPKRYFRKQTLTNVERYYTEEVKQLEDKILRAEERIKEIEKEIFIKLRIELTQRKEDLYSISESISVLDAILSLVEIAYEKEYIKPVIKENKKIIIEKGRHPVVESLIETTFIPNDTIFDDTNNRVLIITGPNMSGKSTYLRQIALITIMAQMGSFVPASRAEIGIVDRVFTRIGASDDLSRGVSTFLAEMSETANILNNMTERSLIILDEIGRGTATYDGLSIAWAVVEYIYKHRIHPRTVFATHYHEITKLSEVYPAIKNYNFSAEETENNIVFIRKLRTGPAKKSYGIEVAGFAGIPQKVIERAKEILEELEQKGKEEISEIYRSNKEQLVLFDIKEPEIITEIKNIDINNITPLEALNILSNWKKKYSKNK